jgi:hypothetical protein
MSKIIACLAGGLMAVASCASAGVMEIGSVDTQIGSITSLVIAEDASAKTKYSLVEIKRDDVSICIVSVKGDCLLLYDAASQSFIAYRPIRVEAR